MPEDVFTQRPNSILMHLCQGWSEASLWNSLGKVFYFAHFKESKISCAAILHASSNQQELYIRSKLMLKGILNQIAFLSLHRTMIHCTAYILIGSFGTSP